MIYVNVTNRHRKVEEIDFEEMKKALDEVDIGDFYSKVKLEVKDLIWKNHQVKWYIKSLILKYCSKVIGSPADGTERTFPSRLEALKHLWNQSASEEQQVSFQQNARGTFYYEEDLVLAILKAKIKCKYVEMVDDLDLQTMLALILTKEDKLLEMLFTNKMVREHLENTRDMLVYFNQCIEKCIADLSSLARMNFYLREKKARRRREDTHLEMAYIIYRDHLKDVEFKLEESSRALKLECTRFILSKRINIEVFLPFVKDSNQRETLRRKYNPEALADPRMKIEFFNKMLRYAIEDDETKKIVIKNRRKNRIRSKLMNAVQGSFLNRSADGKKSETENEEEAEAEEENIEMMLEEMIGSPNSDTLQNSPRSTRKSSHDALKEILQGTITKLKQINLNPNQPHVPKPQQPLQTASSDLKETKPIKFQFVIQEDSGEEIQTPQLLGGIGGSRFMSRRKSSAYPDNKNDSPQIRALSMFSPLSPSKQAPLPSSEIEENSDSEEDKVPEDDGAQDPLSTKRTLLVSQALHFPLKSVDPTGARESLNPGAVDSDPTGFDLLSSKMRYFQFLTSKKLKTPTEWGKSTIPSSIPQNDDVQSSENKQSSQQPSYLNNNRS